MAASIVATSPATRRLAAIATALPTGFRLCGIADDVPRPVPGGLRTSSTSPCGEERDVARDLAKDAATTPEGAGGGRRPVAQRVPRNVRHPESQPRGERLEHGGPLLAQRRERPDGAAELHDPRLLERARERRPARGRVASSHPAALRPNVTGAAGCNERPARLPGGRVPSRELRGAVRRPVDGRENGGTGLLQPQHHRRVHDVLARGAPVHEAGRGRIGPGDDGRQLLHQRDDRRAGARGACRECRAIEFLRGGSGPDGVRRRWPGSRLPRPAPPRAPPPHPAGAAGAPRPTAPRLPPHRRRGTAERPSQPPRPAADERVRHRRTPSRGAHPPAGRCPARTARPPRCAR